MSICIFVHVSVYVYMCSHVYVYEHDCMSISAYMTKYRTLRIPLVSICDIYIYIYLYGPGSEMPGDKTDTEMTGRSCGQLKRLAQDRRCLETDTVCWLLSISQGRICSDSLTCCHTEIEVADQTFYLTRSQYTDTGPTSPSADPRTPGAWQGSHWSANI